MPLAWVEAYDKVEIPADPMAGESRLWFTVGLFPLCPQMMEEGRKLPPDPFVMLSNQSHKDSALMTSPSPSILHLSAPSQSGLGLNKFMNLGQASIHNKQLFVCFQFYCGQIQIAFCLSFACAWRLMSAVPEGL